MAFRVGQKVVCVDVDGDGNRVWHGDVPVVGGVYTVRDTGLCQLPLFNPEICLYFEEIKNNCAWLGIRYEDAGYRASRFRPLVTTSIDWALKILASEDEKVRA